MCRTGHGYRIRRHLRFVPVYQYTLEKYINEMLPRRGAPAPPLTVLKTGQYIPSSVIRPGRSTAPIQVTLLRNAGCEAHGDALHLSLCTVSRTMDAAPAPLDCTSGFPSCGPEIGWYFAYGANMSPAVLTGQRQVQPIRQVRATLPNYHLCFDVPGIPYSEPALAGLCRRETWPPGTPPGLPVHGIAFLVSRGDLQRIVATEGAGVAYTMIQATAVEIQASSDEGGDGFIVTTLVARRPSSRKRRPSRRYLVGPGTVPPLLPLHSHPPLIASCLVTTLLSTAAARGGGSGQ